MQYYILVLKTTYLVDFERISTKPEISNCPQTSKMCATQNHETIKNKTMKNQIAGDHPQPEGWGMQGPPAVILELFSVL
jgi:hypothetical protein